MRHKHTSLHFAAGLCHPLIPVVTIVALGLATAAATVISGFLVAATVAAAE